MKSLGALALVLVVALAGGSPARAQGEEAKWYDCTFSVQIENDKLVDTDQHYTNGFRIGWVSDRKEGGPEWLRDVLEFLYPYPLRGARVGFSFGQSIFTPS